MKKIISGQTYDEERSLYNLKNAEVISCRFEGPKDGESVLKESRHVTVESSSFSLRYPLWHAKDFSLDKSTLDEKTRAPIWYARKGTISHTSIRGIKCLRECKDIKISDCQIDSEEFGWKSKNISVTDSSINSQYLFFDSKNFQISNLTMSGKYSFQYMKNVIISNSTLDTKDAFWHSHNLVVKDSIIKGEYLAWFSDGLTLINCHITGTQPFCYAKNLRLINCTMEGCDLAFEYSQVEADIKGSIKSIKNPKSGTITVDKVDQVITDHTVTKCQGKVIVRK
jgi:hypothetical protein